MSEQALEIVSDKPQELTRRASDVAGLCRDIVIKTAVSIQGRKYVKVEGWQSIATAHGCVASCRDVERVEGGFRAIGEIRRITDGHVLATAEGYVGEDEPTWFGGGPKNLPKRPDYAIRAMCQTRAISRVCRSCFAHVVVLMDAGLSTTPAEEVPDGGFYDEPARNAPAPHNTAASRRTPPPSADGTPAQRTLMLKALEDIKDDLFAYAVDRGIIIDTESLEDWPLDKVVTGIGINALRKGVELWRRQRDGGSETQDAGEGWRAFKVPFGKNKDLPLGELSEHSLKWYVNNYQVKTEYNGKQKKPETIAKDQEFRDALDAAREELCIESEN